MYGLTLSQTSPGFYMSAVQVFLKHCRNKSGKLSQHTPVLPQVAMAKFNYKKQQRPITHKLSKQEL